MSETRAVFLSYASQDTEAARHIAESLRASGVEVWFDVEGGLEHGDEWDAKIRRQIKECVLFIPLVSANTQARHEGYFRIEWELAAQRAMGIASGVAFILPAVIDDTREPDALVPDRFRAVQWTRLPGGVVPPDVQARFLKLWSHRTGVLKHEAVSGGTTTEDRGRRTDDGTDPSRRRKRNPAVIAVAILLLVAIAVIVVWKPWRKDGGSLATSAPAAASLSESRQLLARAWEQMNKAELARAELELADGFCRRAIELDSHDAEAWAAASQVDSWYVYHNLDASAARREGARTKAARALQLAPNSFEARLAHGCQLVRSGADRHVSVYADEADGLLRTLLQEQPDEPRTLLALGILLRNTGRLSECREVLTRMANNPAFAALAWNEIGWALYIANDYPAAETAADASIALQPYWGNLFLKFNLAQRWWGDLDLAKVAIERIPSLVRQEDAGTSMVVHLYHWRGEPEEMLRVLAGMSRDWLQSNFYDGPKAYWSGLAHAMAGRTEAAGLQWQSALKLVEQRLADQPGSEFLLHWRARLLASLGQRDEAETALRLARDMGAVDSYTLDSVAVDLILLGRHEEAIAVLEKRVEQGADSDRTYAFFRLNPNYDPLRDEPRFQALLARMEADPRLSPNARPAPAAIDARAPDDKSVAVLAFANLSDDKGNEYFSDGISEELLNVLAKVPGLKVTARTSAFFFKGKQVPIADIAQQLGVAYVVEGSVRKQGDRVRITAQLIKAADGFPVWSDTFTRDLKDIFAVQDEIAGLIAQQLQLKLGATKVARVVNPEAYRLVLEGRYFWLQRTDEALNRAEASYVEALEHDPQFAQAHAGLADVWSIRAWYKLIGGNRQAQDDLARAHTEVRLAIEIDPSLAETHATLGAVLFNQRKFAEANEAFQTSQRLNPNYGFAHFWYAQLLFAEGRSQEGLLALDRAVRADPLAFITLASYAIFLSQLGLNEEALVMNDRAIALHPDMFVPTIGQRADILLNLGRTEEALALARSVVQQASVEPRWWLDGTVIHALRAAGQLQEAEAHAARLLQTLPPDNMVRGYVLAGVGRPSEAVDQLLATGLESSLIFSFIFDSFWDEVRQDPRLPELLVKLDLVEEYRRGREALAQIRQEQGRKK